MSIKRIVWALDAFQEDDALLRNSVRVIRSFQKSAPALVEPVYILTPAQLNLAVDLTAPWLQQYRPAAEAALRARIAKFRIPDALPPHVIVMNFSSTLQSVQALSAYAASSEADLILASSHGRTGLSRVFLGSFSETLLIQSKVPVFAVGPGIRKVRPFNHILFPTEFGPNSKTIFRYVVRLAKSVGAKLTLFHAVPHPVEPVFQTGVYLLGGAWIPTREFVSKETERRRAHAEAWRRWAEEQGVKTDVIVDIISENIADAIILLADEKKAGFIAMEAQTGPIASVLIGSITRQVVRHAHCPVWVLRAAMLEEKRLKAAA